MFDELIDRSAISRLDGPLYPPISMPVTLQTVPMLVDNIMRQSSWKRGSDGAAVAADWPMAVRRLLYLDAPDADGLEMQSSLCSRSSNSLRCNHVSNFCRR